MHVLSDSEVMDNLLANDRSNVRDMNATWPVDTQMRCVCECACRLLDAIALDWKLGGNKFEKVAIANLCAAAKQYAKYSGRKNPFLIPYP